MTFESEQKPYTSTSLFFRQRIFGHVLRPVLVVSGTFRIVPKYPQARFGFGALRLRGSKFTRMGCVDAYWCATLVGALISFDLCYAKEHWAVVFQASGHGYGCMHAPTIATLRWTELFPTPGYCASLRLGYRWICPLVRPGDATLWCFENAAYSITANIWGRCVLWPASLQRRSFQDKLDQHILGVSMSWVKTFLKESKPSVEGLDQYSPLASRNEVPNMIHLLSKALPGLTATGTQPPSTLLRYS